MSKVGKNPIVIPTGVQVKIEQNHLSVKGPKGELSIKIRPEIMIELKENNDEKEIIRVVKDLYASPPKDGDEILHEQEISISPEQSFSTGIELKGEPAPGEIIRAIGDPSIYEEVIFCGFGEPLLRLEVLIEVSRWLKEKGSKIRINTDGLANAVHKRNILPELEGLVDSISVSLNADNSELYGKLCRPPFEGAYNALKQFILEAKKYIPDVTASIVELPNVNVEKCRQIAEQELGVKFRLRPYNEVG